MTSKYFIFFTLLLATSTFAQSFKEDSGREAVRYAHDNETIYGTEQPSPPGLGWEYQQPEANVWTRHKDWAVVQDLIRQIHELEQRILVLEKALKPQYPDGVIIK